MIRKRTSGDNHKILIYNINIFKVVNSLKSFYETQLSEQNMKSEEEKKEMKIFYETKMRFLYLISNLHFSTLILFSSSFVLENLRTPFSKNGRKSANR